MTVLDLYEYLDQRAPFSTALSFDNCGILLGDEEARVTKALVCLDVTDAVAKEAIACGAELIISHHPVIFHGLKRILKGDLVYQLIQAGITVVSAHTNLDMAEYGVNHQLAMACGLVLDTIRCFPKEEERQTDGCGLVGRLESPLQPEELALSVKESLSAGCIKLVAGSREIETVVVSCGAGSFLLDEAIYAGVDALVTSEVKHHEMLAAKAAGLTLIDAGHYETEQIVIRPLAEELAEQFSSISFYTAGENPATYL